MKFGLSEEIYNKILKIVRKNNIYTFKIFGSRAKNTYKNTSDSLKDNILYDDLMEESNDLILNIFDILEQKENVTKEDEYAIRNEFDLLNIVYKIDLVFISDSTKKEFLKEINKEGIEIKWKDLKKEN